jgi:hypothetical protein
MYCRPQSTYRGREEIGDCICPLSWSEHHNFVRDGRYSEKGGGRGFGLIFPS